MKAVFTFAILFAGTKALACPKLMGNYSCANDTAVLVLQIDQKIAGNVSTYTFQDKLIGLYPQIITDGQSHDEAFLSETKLADGSPLFRNGKYSATCSGDTILAKWHTDVVSWKDQSVVEQWTGYTQIKASAKYFKVIETLKTLELNSGVTTEQEHYMDCQPL